MLVGHTLAGTRAKGLPLLHKMESLDSGSGTCGFVCHPQTPRIVNGFSARRGTVPRSIVFPSTVSEIFEDNRHESESPILGVRTLDNRIYFFPIKEGGSEPSPHKKAKSSPQLRTIFSKSPSKLSVNNVVSMQHFPCVMCRNEIILFGKKLKDPPIAWKIPVEVCGSSLTDYLWIQDTAKVAPELILDLSSRAGCIKSGKQKLGKDLIIFGDSLGHVFWTQSPDGKAKQTENPQIFYTAEARDPISRIFMASRDGSPLLDTIVVVTSKGFVKVLWWNHVKGHSKNGKTDELSSSKMEFQFQLDEEDFSKFKICFSNVKRIYNHFQKLYRIFYQGKILLVSGNNGIRVFNPFMQPQAFGVRERTRPAFSAIHQDWDIWAVSDGFRPGSRSAVIVTRDGRIVSEEIQQDAAASSSSSDRVSNVLWPLIASTKALSCQEKVFGGIGNVLWSHLSVVSEVLEVLRIVRDYPGSLSVDVNLAGTGPRSQGLSIECKLHNKSVVKLSRGVWCFYLNVYIAPLSSPDRQKLQKFSVTIPITEDVEPDAVWVPPSAIFLESMSVIGPPFVVEGFLILAERGPIEEDEERQRLLAAKVSAKAGLPAPLFMRNFAPSVSLSLGEKRVFGGLDVLCVHPNPTILSGDKSFEVTSIGFERRLGTALLHQITKTFQERVGNGIGEQKEVPFPVALSLPGTKGDYVASVSLVQENAVTMLRIRASRKYFFGIHAALLFEVVQCLDRVGTEPDPHQMEWRSAVLQIAKDMRVSVGELLSKFECLEREYLAVKEGQFDVHARMMDQILGDLYKISNKWIIADLSSCKLVILG